LYNKSSISLRKHLIDNRYIEEIIDFKNEKVFKGISVYCCITVFTKKPKEYLIYNGNKVYYSSINDSYSIFTNFVNEKTNELKNICKITNGIATLRDKIYIHSKKIYDEPCWKEITDSNITKYIIYPYDNNAVILNEETFKSENPQTYSYLLTQKDELSKRDNGNKKYATWYAFGRTQSLKKPGKKSIYIPSFLNPDEIEDKMNTKEPILFQGCLCIEPHDINVIDIIKKSIIDNIEYIKSVSSKRSGGWINISTNTLYQLPYNVTQ
jgi:hypothetical protein